MKQNMARKGKKKLRKRVNGKFNNIRVGSADENKRKNTLLQQTSSSVRS
jgi:hypothetical protein